MTPRANRSVVVVLRDGVSDTEAAMTRNGLLMFNNVARVVPVKGIPNDAQALAALDRDDLIQARRRAEAQRDEAVARLNEIGRLATGLESPSIEAVS